MDPNANLAEQLRIASRMIEAADTDRDIRVADPARLAELVIALDEWIKGGGFLPAAWVRR
jgi:hypothetical protein